MAGKHVGADLESASIGPNYIPGSKIDRAYAEGRLASFKGLAATANPHDGKGTPEETAWDAGYTAASSAAKQYETGSAGASALYQATQTDMITEGEGILVSDDPLNATYGVNAGGVYQNGAYRFTSIAIAQGTTISSAILTLGASLGNQNGTPALTVACQDVDNASAPASGNCPGNTGGGTWISTTASTAWDGSTLTVDVTTSVQEVLNRVGWASGQAINIGLRASAATPSNNRTIVTPTVGALLIT